jgi:pimeloyl-ACP methyl ester carboxylesterase
MADELRRGLAGAGIDPPYLLAGHSLGGIIARRFAARYPRDVAGMVLIESSHEDQARRFRHADGGWWRPRAHRMARVALRRRARVLGVRRLLVVTGHSQLNKEIEDEVPAEFAGAARAVFLTAKHRRAVVREMLLMTRSHGDPPGLGALPLTVLTAARRDDETWMQMQDELASLSTQSEHVIADHGGHYLQKENPALVSSEIRGLVQRIREAGPTG